MGAISLGGILKAEHELLHEAFCEWCGMGEEDAPKDILYLQGVHDMAHKLVLKLDPNGDADA